MFNVIVSCDVYAAEDARETCKKEGKVENIFLISQSRANFSREYCGLT